jgi:hypothetical protein
LLKEGIEAVKEDVFFSFKMLAFKNFLFTSPETNKQTSTNKQTKTFFMSIRNYITNAKAANSQKYADWTGGFAGMTGPAGPRQAQASGVAAASAAQSQPYIITVANASATAVSNFDVLGAYEYINNAGWSGGSLTVNNVTISSSISNVTYQQFLYQSMTQPFSVGLTYIQSVSGSSSQISESFVINTRDANGNQNLRTIVPIIDPYQQQNGVVQVKQLYGIDGYTKLTFANVLASVVFKLMFFPSTNINLASGLNGNPVSQSYTNPNITGVPTYIQQ